MSTRKKILLKNTNEPIVNIESNKIKENLTSYAPTINMNLVSRRSGANKTLRGCNTKRALQLKDTLKISSIGGKCLPYTNPTAKKIMLNRLKLNKHVNIKTLVPPMQMEGNCWFNTMFMTFFVSDKGRKFFHFFRQLMIEGKLFNGNEIPKNLKGTFALLNYAVDLALSGGPGATVMDTNYIISELYERIPKTHDANYIVDVGDASNPLKYYTSIMSYLDNSSLSILNVTLYSKDWNTAILSSLQNTEQLPHIFAIEIVDNESTFINNKPLSFKIKDGVYALDSAVIRNTEQYHFSSVLTCEKKGYAYDGMSFHKIVAMNWKKMINTNKTWAFEGSEDEGKLLEWNFMKGYQILMYYRIK